METVTKTLRFWLGDVGDEDFKLLHELSRALASAHEAFVRTALMHVFGGGKANNDCLREARQAYQAEFAKSGFMLTFGDTHAANHAFKDFKAQWARLRRGEKTSISLRPGSHADITLWASAGKKQVRIERVEDDWFIIGAGLRKGETKALKEDRQWKLIPQTNRTKRNGARQAARTLMQMSAAETRNMVRLVWRPGRGWEAQVVVTLPAAKAKAAEEVVCGVDIGMNHLLVASLPDGRKQWWFGAQHGREIWRALDEAAQHRRTLMRAGKRRAARGWGDKISRKRNHVCELASRRLVDWMKQHGVTKLRMEDLTGIRDRLTDRDGMSADDRRWNLRLGSWPFFKLQQRIEQKCAEAGIEVELVNPKNTSIMCSNCGHVDAKNRAGKQFKCLRCGYEQHADLNAANNVARGGEVDFDSPIEGKAAAVALCRPRARP